MQQQRVRALDIVRGIVMVLMAIDHVRVYAGVPAGSPVFSLFFTRWVTHFCAPVFVFLAGTGAYLYGRRVNDARKLARYLVTRGLLLVVLELTLIRFTWTFNLDFSRFVLAGVIWMIGWCMVLLATMVRLRPAVVGAIGVAIVALQPLFAYVPSALPEAQQQSIGWLWEFIYPSGLKVPHVTVLYVIVPWIGVMAAGYGFGALVTASDATRRRWFLRIGLAMTAIFLVAATIGAMHAGPNAPPFIYRLLGQQKYPASALFLMMTLGPTIVFLPVVERWRGRVSEIFETFGQVPMFYYLLHIPAIHIAALIVNALRGSGYHPEWYATAPFAAVAPGAQWGLPLLYLTWLAVVAALYRPCRWFDGVKHARRGSWLRFI